MNESRKSCEGCQHADRELPGFVTCVEPAEPSLFVDVIERGTLIPQTRWKSAAESCKRYRPRVEEGGKP